MICFQHGSITMTDMQRTLILSFSYLYFVIENYKLNMDLFLQQLNTTNRRPLHPTYPQSKRPPPRQQAPPLMQYSQPRSYQNAGYAPQNRPNPQVRPPPPPFMPPTGAYQGRGRPHQPSFPRQQNRQTFGNERIDPNIRSYGSYGGRESFTYQNRGFRQQDQGYNDQTYQRERQNYFQQRQIREEQNFNRNEEEGNYQRRQQNFSNYQKVQFIPNYHNNQNYPRKEFRQNYSKRNQQADNQQMRQKSRNYQQSEQRQFQRPQNLSRDNYRGRGADRGRTAERGLGDRGRGRGRGRQMPPQLIQNKKEQRVYKESQEDHEKSSVIEEQFSSQTSNALSEQQGSNQPVSQSQQQYQISREGEQSQQDQQNQSQERGSQESLVEDKEEEDMQRIDVMCSRQQFQERLQTFRMNNRGKEAGLRLDTGRSFAIFEINKRTNEPDISLALKRFRRSTNRAEDQNEKEQTADCPRSRKGLTLTLKHILKQIIDSDGMRPRDLAFPIPSSEKKIEFLHIYDFLWNRMREMIKDVSRLQIRDRDTHEVITICEQMLRFFIIAVKEGRGPHACKLQFDPKMNLQSITKILTQLLQIYENNHYALSKEPNSNAYISPNQPQITSYAILISHDLQNTLYQKLRLRVDGLGIGHPLLDCSEVKRALQIKKALKMRDYENFYNILQSRQTDYTQGCILIHHLPTIRRQTLRVLQKSSEIQSSTKNRKIPLMILRRNLRFSEKLNEEFKQFIDHIGVRIVKEFNEPYVILNEFNESLEDHLSSYAFDFPQNKKDRKFYANSPKKVTMIDSTLISREQLIKRLWYEGSYLEECKSYYSQQKIPPKKNQKKIQKPQMVQIPQMLSPLLQENQHKKAAIETKQHRQREEIKQDNKKKNFLLQKRNEFNRPKFIKALEGLIQNLVKKSDVHSQHQKKIGLQMVFQFIEILERGLMSKGFHRLRQFMHNQRIASQTINNIRELAIQKSNFFSSFYRANSEFNNFITGKTFDTLSNKVENIRSDHNPMLTQLREVALKAQTPRTQLKILLFFTSSASSPLSQMQITFLKHLAEFMSGKVNDSSFLSEVEDLCYLRLPCSKLSVSRNLNDSNDGILITICFHHCCNDQNDSLFFCGFDTVFFVDLHNDSNIFKKYMEDFIDTRKKATRAVLGKCPKLEISFYHLIVATLDKLRLKNTLIGLNQLQSEGSKNLLEQQSLKLSWNLRQSILQAVAWCISKPQKEKQDFQAVAVTNMVSQIQQNLSFAQSLCKQPISLEQFEKYFLANIKCMREAIKKAVTYYESCDWKQILLEAYYLKRPQISTKLIVPQNKIYYHHHEKVNLHSMLSKKFEVCNQVTHLLQQTNFFNRYQAKKRQRPYASNFHALAAAIEQYLSAFSIKERGGQFELIAQYIAEHNCSLQFTDESIKGESRVLICYILAQLKKQLMYINILLPSQFKFKIHKDVLVPKPPKKRPALDKVAQPKMLEQKQGIKQLPLPKLHYKYQELLEELNKDLQEYNLRMNPVKAVKT